MGKIKNLSNLKPKKRKTQFPSECNLSWECFFQIVRKNRQVFVLFFMSFSHIRCQYGMSLLILTFSFWEAN